MNIDIDNTLAGLQQWNLSLTVRGETFGVTRPTTEALMAILELAKTRPSDAQATSAIVAFIKPLIGGEVKIGTWQAAQWQAVFSAILEAEGHSRKSLNIRLARNMVAAVLGRKLPAEELIEYCTAQEPIAPVKHAAPPVQAAVPTPEALASSAEAAPAPNAKPFFGVDQWPASQE